MKGGFLSGSLLARSQEEQSTPRLYCKFKKRSTISSLFLSHLVLFPSYWEKLNVQEPGQILCLFLSCVSLGNMDLIWTKLSLCIEGKVWIRIDRKIYQESNGKLFEAHVACMCVKLSWCNKWHIYTERHQDFATACVKPLLPINSSRKACECGLKWAKFVWKVFCFF